MKQSRLRKATIATAIIVITLGVVVVVGWQICWRSPPFYSYDRAAALPVPILSMAEYGDLSPVHARPFVVQIEADGDGAVLLFGAEHTRDPGDPQLESIEAGWAAFRPTVALVEGRLGFFIDGVHDPVERYGESGFVNALARRAGLPVYSWEPPRVREIEIVLRAFPPRRVALFYVLRPYFSNLRHGGIDDPDGYVQPFLERRTAYRGLEGTLASVAEIDAMWQADFAGLPDWRETSDEYGLPGYLAEIAAAGNAARDEHFAQVIIDLVRRGERVYAIAGSSHAVKLDAALRALLGPAPGGMP
ncbi:MAG: hypothetical protein ACYTGG_12325 [Planctomycetota bacterium]|jgi:hypothetical protein